jgi:hypothetical protein
VVKAAGFSVLLIVLAMIAACSLLFVALLPPEERVRQP